MWVGIHSSWPKLTSKLMISVTFWLTLYRPIPPQPPSPPPTSSPTGDIEVFPERPHVQNTVKISKNYLLLVGPHLLSAIRETNTRSDNNSMNHNANCIGPVPPRHQSTGRMRGKHEEHAIRLLVRADCGLTGRKDLSLERGTWGRSVALDCSIP